MRRSSRSRSPRHHAAAPRSKTWPTPRWRRRSRSSPASGWSPSAADRSRPCAFRRIPARSPSYGLSLEDLRTAIAAANVNQAKGNFDGPRQAYTIGANDQLLTSRRLQAHHHRLPQRRAGALSDVADVVDGVGEHHAGRVDERHARRHRERPAAARREHHRRGRPHQGASAAASAARCRASIKVQILTDRTEHHPRLGARRPVRADAHHRAGRDGDLPFPAHARAPRSSPASPCRSRSSAPSA